MEALRYLAPGKVDFVEIARPRAEAGELLVELTAVCTCPRWDITLWDGSELFEGRPHEYPQAPGWPGHEGAGVVVEVGAGVSGFAEGDHVAIWHHSFPGGQGLYTPFSRVRVEGVAKLKPATPVFWGAPFEMLVDVVYAVDKLGDIRGQQVAVAGLGPAGLLAVQIAHAYGAAEVVGLEIAPERLEYAVKHLPWMKPLATVPPDMVGVVDKAVECVGAAASIEALMQLARKQVVVFGVPHGKMAYRVRDWSREVTLEGVNIGKITQSQVGRSRDLMESGDVNTAILLTHEGSLRRYEETINLLKSRKAIKVLFSPAEELRK